MVLGRLFQTTDHCCKGNAIIGFGSFGSRACRESTQPCYTQKGLLASNLRDITGIVYLELCYGFTVGYENVINAMVLKHSHLSRPPTAPISAERSPLPIT